LPVCSAPHANNSWHFLSTCK